MPRNRRLPNEPGNADRVALGTAVNAGLVQPAGDADGEWVLADDVRYSLMLE